MQLGNSETLYIRIGRKAIVFARYDRIKDSTLNYNICRCNPGMSQHANIQRALKRLPLAKGDFLRVVATVESRPVLVPLNEFAEDDILDIYRYNYPDTKPRTRVLYDTLPALNAIMLFGIDKDLYKSLIDAYPNITIHCSLIPLLLHQAQEGMLDTPSPDGGKGCKTFVSLEDGGMAVSVFREGRLQALSTYSVSTSADALYYTLALDRAVGMTPSADQIFVAGQQEQADELVQLLRTYMPHTMRLKAEDEFNHKVMPLVRDLPYDMIIMLLRAY